MMSCSHHHKPLTNSYESDLVTVQTTLDHIGQSYTLGCVEAYRAQNISQKYPECRDLGMKHKEDVRLILIQPIKTQAREKE
jgi:hypothetical protein